MLEKTANWIAKIRIVNSRSIHFFMFIEKELSSMVVVIFCQFVFNNTAILLGVWLVLMRSLIVFSINILLHKIVCCFVNIFIKCFICIKLWAALKA